MESWMRSVPFFILCLSLCTCGTERVVTPREYLDERTAATITVVRDPWIFTRGTVRASSGEYRDFLHLYAVDVNRMGEHKQYLAALIPEQTAEVDHAPSIELKAHEWSL